MVDEPRAPDALRRMAAAVLLLALAVAACVATELDQRGRRCPCAVGYVCAMACEVCVPASEADGGLEAACPSDGGAPDGSADAGPQDSGPPDGAIIVARATAPPVFGTDAGWYSSSLLFRFDNAAFGGDNTFAVYGLWDENALYLAVDVKDADLYSIGSGLWEQDALEVFFDVGLKRGATMVDGDQAFRQYLFAIDGRYDDNYGACELNDPSFTGSTTPYVTLFGTLNGFGTGFLMELRFPWAELGGTVRAGQVIGFDLASDDRDAADGGTVMTDYCLKVNGVTETYAVPDGWCPMWLAP